MTFQRGDLVRLKRELEGKTGIPHVASSMFVSSIIVIDTDDPYDLGHFTVLMVRFKPEETILKTLQTKSFELVE